MADLFLDKIDVMKKNGYDEEIIAELFGFETVKLLRKRISERNRENRIVLQSMAREMKESGETIADIAKKLGKNESSIKLLLDYDCKSSVSYEKLKKDLEEMKNKGILVTVQVLVERA